MDLGAAVTIERPGATALDINSLRDPAGIGSSPVSGYLIEQVDFSSVPITAFTEDTPLVDGVDSYDPYLSARTISMVVSVYGSSYGDFWDKITALNAALQAQPKSATGTQLDADGKRKLSFSQPKASGSYSLYMMVRPMALPRFVTDAASAAGDDSRGYSVRCSIVLMAEDPYKYFADTSSFTVTGSGTASVVNTGTTIAWPTVTWNVTSTTTVGVTLGSQTVTHTGATANVTDTFKTATSTNAATLTSYSFFSIPPGTSSVSVTGQSGQTTTITIREAIL